MKKSFIFVFMAFLVQASTVFADDFKYTYVCGQAPYAMTLKLKFEDKGPVAFLQFQSREGNDSHGNPLPTHQINIYSEPANLAQEPSRSEDLKAMELPNESVTFGNFHYPSHNGKPGEMYIPAEDDTNEEWFTFAVEKKALDGGAEVKAGTYYGSDWGNPDVDTFTCKKQ